MIRNLQALRFVFCFSILVSHLLGHRYSTFGLDEYGVVGFFVLSGFVLSVAYGRKIDSNQFHTRQFFLKQWLKLYPLHILTFILAIFYEAHYGKYYDWYQLIPPVFMLQSWIPNETFHYIPNASSWSLGGFFFYYLLFSSLYVFFTRLPLRRLIPTLALLVIGYVAVMMSVPEEYVYPFLYLSPLMRLPDFMLGIVLYRLFHSDYGNGIKNRLGQCSVGLITMIELLVLIAPVISFLLYPYLNHAFRCVSLFWLFVGAQLLLFSWNDDSGGLVTKVLHSRPFTFLGSISFEIYLIHMFIVPSSCSMAVRLGFFEHGIVPLLIATPIVVVLSYLAKRFVVDKTYYFLIKYVS